MEKLPGIYSATRTMIETTEDHIQRLDISDLEYFKLIPQFFDQVYDLSFEIMKDLMLTVEYENELSSKDEEIFNRCLEIVEEIGTKNIKLKQIFDELED